MEKGNISLSSSDGMNSQSSETQRRTSKKRTFIMLVAVVVVIITVCVIIAVVVNARVDDNYQSKPKEKESSSKNDFIQRFFHKVQKAFIECNQDMVAFKPKISIDEIRTQYRPFDYSPANVKKVADIGAHLRAEFSEMITKEVESTLTEKELKGVYEMRQFLRHFGVAGPYSTSYYTGVWMLGPNSMLWEPIEYMWSWIETIFTDNLLKPKTLTEFKQTLDIMSMYKDSINNYTENMKMGVKRGMVRNIEACKAGLKAFKYYFRGFAIRNETEILESKFLQPEYLKNINDSMKKDWERMYRKSMTSSLREALIMYIGKPVTNLIRYMANEHMRHCVPSNVSSGLANLPLPYVYIDGKPDLLQPTMPYLPTGERLNGSQAFDNILTYYTTTDITATEIQAMGYQKLSDLKAQVVELAKEVTDESNETVAVKMFREKLSNRSLYFNHEPFPANESRDDTFLYCFNVMSAQQYCPKRFQAYSNWKRSSQKIQKSLQEKIKALFYSTGAKKTTLSCSADVSPNFNPMSSFHSYTPIKPCGKHTLPFFIDDYGPKYAELTVTAHETEPGHNLEVFGYSQNFANKSKTDVFDWLTKRTYFSSFSEGWATYAEYPLVGKDLDLYRNDLMAKYGMLQQQIMGALRLVIETGLHSMGMSRSAAIQLFKEHAWETGDIATKEITRYQSVQGHSVSYIIGQTAFMKARALAEKELGSKFSLKDFHYHILRQGEVPLQYLDHVIGRYINCSKDLTTKPIDNYIGKSCLDVWS